MDRLHTFARDEIAPSYWANRLQDFVSLLSSNFRLTQLNATTLRVPASAGNGACIGIQGLWRFVEANVDRAHPGGAAGTYDVYVTAAAQNVVNVPAANTDNTVYSFALAIVAAGATPPIVAGVVDVYRKVGSVQWSGAAITQIDTIVQMPSDAMPIDGPAGQATRRTLGTGAQQATAGNDSRLTNARTPTAHKTTHEPGGTDALTLLDDTSMAAAVKDGLVSRASLRTLGTGAQQAAPGNDSRFPLASPYVKSFRSTNVSLATGAVVVFDAESDPNNWYDPVTGKFQPTRAGRYLCQWRVAFSAVVATGVWLEAGLVDPSAVYLAKGQPVFQSPGRTMASVGSGIFNANGTTDYAQIVLEHSVGAAQALATGVASTFFCAELVGT